MDSFPHLGPSQQGITMTMNNYQALSKLSERAHILDGISGFLGWDQETYMPVQAFHIRAKQKALLSEMAHTIKTSPEFEKALSSLIDLESGAILMEESDPARHAALHAWRHDFLRFKKLPPSFVEEFTQLTSEAIFIWDKAKKENQFTLFEPSLHKIVEKLKEKAELLGYVDHPYDALLDEYEPGCTTKDVDTLFSHLGREIPPLLKELMDRQELYPQKSIQPEFSAAEQMEICKKVLDAIGYDWSRGRLDLSSHPFSTSYHPTDCRITTRLESHGLIIQVLTILHEAGHSFYEMGLLPEFHGTPLGEPISMGIHESESRSLETRIGRTLAFWQFLLPHIQKMFPGKVDDTTPESLFTEMSRVAPSLIRTDSDEVTYPLHVLLRFQIEKELIEGTLKTKEIPERWNSCMKTLLGIVPPTDREGCLQDIHWAMGGFGYFPTYTLGNIYAAQFFTVFEKQYPDWQERVRQGEFEFIKEWHRQEVHRHGRRYTSRELVKKITGSDVTSEPYVRYLSDKYRAIFPS